MKEKTSELRVVIVSEKERKIDHGIGKEIGMKVESRRGEETEGEG